MVKRLFSVNVNEDESLVFQVVAFKNGYQRYLDGTLLDYNGSTYIHVWSDKDITMTDIKDEAPVLNLVDAIKIVLGVVTVDSVLQEQEAKKWPKTIGKKGEVFSDGSVNLKSQPIMNKDDMLKVCSDYLRLFPQE